jgi:ParB-like chromosome segregation protein Spo0J
VTDLNLAGEYAEAMLMGAAFPPVVVFGDGGDGYWLADGYHRWHAATIAGLQTIGADVRPGGRREAILHSAGANAEHGWRRSSEDKRRAVRTLLNDPEWRQWSDREISRRCGVDGKTVAALRPSAEIPQIGAASVPRPIGTVLRSA